MPRTYRLRRRAERQDETRQRIVQAAVDLHTTVGPSRTTVAAIAARAGVQRHTVYRHFPDARSLGMACSALYSEQHPLPDPAGWRAESDPAARVRRGLAELYGYFERNAEALAPLVRDAEVDPLIQELVTLRFGPPLERARDVMAEPFAARGAARQRLLTAIEAALDFTVWRRIRRSAPSCAAAVDVAARAVAGQV